MIIVESTFLFCFPFWVEIDDDFGFKKSASESENECEKFECDGFISPEKEEYERKSRSWGRERNNLHQPSSARISQIFKQQSFLRKNYGEEDFSDSSDLGENENLDNYQSVLSSSQDERNNSFFNPHNEQNSLQKWETNEPLKFHDL